MPARSRGCVSRGNPRRRHHGLSHVPRQFVVDVDPSLWQVRLRPAAGRASARSRGSQAAGIRVAGTTGSRTSDVSSLSTSISGLWQVRLRPAAGRCQPSPRLVSGGKRAAHATGLRTSPITSVVGVELGQLGRYDSRIRCVLLSFAFAPIFQVIPRAPSPMQEMRPYRGRDDHLKRLPVEYYRGQAYVHWSMTIHNRQTGWLSRGFYVNFRASSPEFVGEFRLIEVAERVIQGHFR